MDQVAAFAIDNNCVTMGSDAAAMTTISDTRPTKISTARHNCRSPPTLGPTRRRSRAIYRSRALETPATVLLSEKQDMQIFAVSSLRGSADRLIPRANPLCHYNTYSRRGLWPHGYLTRLSSPGHRNQHTAKDEGHVILLCQGKDSWTSAVGAGKRDKKAAAGEQFR